MNTVKYKDFDWFYRRIKSDIDLHQQKKYTSDFGEKDLVHQGFELGEDILRKLYYDNPKKVFGY